MRIFKFKLTFLFFFLIFNSTMIEAQSDFRPGYIITLQGDSIKGLINYGGDAANAKSCTFKKKIHQKKVIYTPDQISAYRFYDGKYYISNNSINYKFKTPAFLEYVIKGAVSIYYYKDGERERYFTTKDTLVLELDHYVNAGSIPKEEDKIDKVSQKYRGQLMYLMKDQPSLFEKLNGISCNSKDLISLTKQYQKLVCPSQECLLYEKKTLKDVKLKFEVFCSAGISNLSSPPYNMYISDYDVTKSLDFKSSSTYEFGVSLNLYLNFMGENKFCIQLSPALNYVEDYKSYIERPLYPMVYGYKANINFTTLKIPLAFKYSLYSSNWSVIPFAKFGLGCAVYLNQNGTYGYGSSNGEHPVLSYSESLTTNYDSKPKKVYFIAGIGTDIKCGKSFLSVGANFEYGSGQLEGYRSDAMLQIGFQL